MLGKYVRVRVTQPIGSVHATEGFRYQLNYGVVKGPKEQMGAFIMGIRHPVKEFDGRVIAVIYQTGTGKRYLVLAPRGRRYIINEIRPSVSFAFRKTAFSINCLYERSCGAVVYREYNGQREYLLIKNKRSEHWGFPKGHMEDGENEQQTAMREVLEETGLHVELLPVFSSRSAYTIQGRVEKQVTIFLATTKDTKTVIQEEEIEDYIWLPLAQAMKQLKFENDRSILQRADAFLRQRAKRFAKSRRK